MIFQSSGTTSDYANEYELELINRILGKHIKEHVKKSGVDDVHCPLSEQQRFKLVSPATL